MHSHIPKVNPEFVHEKLSTGLPVHLIDVRSSDEYTTQHADGARLFPLADISADSLHQQLSPAVGVTEPVYLICTAGLRAEQAAEKLKGQGLSKLFIINGGTDAWQKARLPTVTVSKKLWSVNLSPQAQAQLFIGILLLVFTVKGLLLHPLFIMLLGFVGLMMLVSSFDQRFLITNVFSDLPWNKADQSN